MTEDVKELADRLMADKRVVGKAAAAVEAHAADLVFGARKRVRLVRGYDCRAVSARSAIDCSRSRCVVQQGMKDEVDINTIVRRFGFVPVSRGAAPGVYGDFTGITDYESAVARIERARAGFSSLPAEVRERFANDPGRFYSETGSMTAEQLDGLIPAPAEPVPETTLNDVVKAVEALKPPE